MFQRLEVSQVSQASQVSVSIPTPQNPLSQLSQVSIVPGSRNPCTTGTQQCRDSAYHMSRHHIGGGEFFINSSNVDCFTRYACLFPLCGKVIACREPLLIQRRTVVSSTRRRRATSRTVNSFSSSSAIVISPY